MHEFTIADASKEHLEEAESTRLMLGMSAARSRRARVYTMPVPSFPDDEVQFVFVTKSKDIIAALARMAEAEGGSDLNRLAKSVLGEMKSEEIEQAVGFPDDNPDLEGWLFIMSKEKCRHDEPHGHKNRIRFFVSK